MWGGDSKTLPSVSILVSSMKNPKASCCQCQCNKDEKVQLKGQSQIWHFDDVNLLWRLFGRSHCCHRIKIYQIQQPTAAKLDCRLPLGQEEERRLVYGSRESSSDSWSFPKFSGSQRLQRRWAEEIWRKEAKIKQIQTLNHLVLSAYPNSDIL